MRLAARLSRTDSSRRRRTRTADISAITEDSRRARRGSLFVAVPGTSLDGSAYVPDAVSRGAAAVVVERAGAVPPDVPFLRVPSARIALAELSARLHRSPPVGLRLIGFTGTRGKTSTSEKSCNRCSTPRLAVAPR